MVWGEHQCLLYSAVLRTTRARLMMVRNIAAMPPATQPASKGIISGDHWCL